jgi:hypothetical protein
MDLRRGRRSKNRLVEETPLSPSQTFVTPLQYEAGTRQAVRIAAGLVIQWTRPQIRMAALVLLPVMQQALRPAL